MISSDVDHEPIDVLAVEICLFISLKNQSNQTKQTYKCLIEVIDSFFKGGSRHETNCWNHIFYRNNTRYPS